MKSINRKIFGTANDREIKRFSAVVDQINALEPRIRPLSDIALAGQTGLFKERLSRGEPLGNLLPEAFATVREAGARVLGQRHFDVQLMGGLALHEGKIAEMKTGEGKTLAATLPVYLNALLGRGVHVVTVNDYLARRDAAWMGALYSFLGLSVGIIVHGLNDRERRDSYLSDVTYGTNNEFGFDYLRDNMKSRLDDYVQREFYFAIVDEVDSILIDEARTPLIISGPAEKSTDLYLRADRVIPQLTPNEDYTLDEKGRSASLTDAGVSRAEDLLGLNNLYDSANLEILHHLTQALKAHTLFKRDKDYLVTPDKQVVIVDEFTGRPMAGRRYSDGLHQALEAKEKVKIENENQTLASITFQNYFRMYEKLAGMTGTADTEAAEFAKIYKLGVTVIPTHRRMIRLDHQDVIYRTQREKYKAVVEEIEELHKKGQPVLVGTISIAQSENISQVLKKKDVPHNVLNAKQHEQEAMIVAQAGQAGQVTISTNMAGRGTDIVLGPGVPELGGLFILGTERHESRRIDNQLRGRSGRQGDPGESRFYLSLEDDLMRIFGGDRFKGLMERLGMTEGVPLEAKLISRGIENAQKQVENHNFEIRKHLLEYDDVMNKQREVVYSQRRRLLTGDHMEEPVLTMFEEQILKLVDQYADHKIEPENWDWKAISGETSRLFGFGVGLEDFDDLSPNAMAQVVYDRAKAAFEARQTELGPEMTAELTRWLLLTSLDSQWKDHLLSMDRLKDGIGLRGYAQKDPLREYQREGFDLFGEMLDRVRADSISLITHVQIRQEADLEELAPKKSTGPMILSHGGQPEERERAKPQPETRETPKIGRNDPCPCGSGKKYKQCCGR
ncbi:MAG: preprotein translocase subunit SecA [Candidatus Adiutrix sp.]|jgi:preprotein translocase subunit SecA|nr:preprotein translocase subunit SecA [Candidatus Adiutrix sp.]